MDHSVTNWSRITLIAAPLVVLQLILVLIALLDLRRRKNIRGPKWIWVLLILFSGLVGPIAYLVIGRRDD